MTSVKAEPYETIVNNGNSQNRVDVAIVGDGYTQAEQQKYKDDVQSLIQGHFGQEPFLEYRTFFNVHRIDVVSAQSGADHPERSSLVNTAFDATYNCSGIQRLICVNNSKVNTVTTNTLNPAQRDLIFVLVNDSEYGGSGGAVAVASTNAAAVDLILHEEGHSFGFLADEYGGPPPPNCSNSLEPSSVNATRETARAQIKWNQWIDPGTPLPTNTTNPGIPGLYEGAAYCDNGLYRPTYVSKMRSLSFPFEQINNEQLVKRIYNFVLPLDSRSPAGGGVTLPRGQTQSFSVSTPAPRTHNLTVSWLVDGLAQTVAPSFNFNSNNFSAGSHTVTATIHDGTSFVRSDPVQLLNATTSWNVNVVNASQVQLDAAFYNKGEGDVQVNLTVTRTGDLSGPLAVEYFTSDSAFSNACNVNSGAASSRCDYLTTVGSLRFAPNEGAKVIKIPIINDAYAEGNESFSFTIGNPSGGTLGSPSIASIQITDDDAVNGANPIDGSAFFVRQHYVDFLNREPDANGLNFWTGEIDNCTPKPQCTELKRINVSAAFFLAIEFQETGFLVYRFYMSSYGTPGPAPVPVEFLEFLADTQQMGQGVVVGVGNWQAQLESNKVAFSEDFVSRSRFLAKYPTTKTPAEFVDGMFAAARVVPSAPERNAAINEFNGAANTSEIAARGRALRRVADNPILVAFEKNRAFVLMQYFGYLRRNPFDPPESTRDFTGYNFWLAKLNQFGGNFINAEMVKAFITSGEYRQRFGP